MGPNADQTDSTTDQPRTGELVEIGVQITQNGVVSPGARK